MAPLVVDSGNGWHLYYPLRPADDGAGVPELLKLLAALHNTPHARIDTTVGNPARVMKCPGTLTRKGRASADRPYRYCRVIEIPEGWPNHVPDPTVSALGVGNLAPRPGETGGPGHP